MTVGWDRTRLAEVSEVRTGIALGKERFVEPGVEVPYLRVANVQDGRIDLSEVRTIRVSLEEQARYSLEPNDVLLTEGGDFDKLGRGSLWGGAIRPCLHQNHVFAVRANASRLLPKYLALYAASPMGKAYFLGCAKQTTNLASINSKQLRDLPLLLPPLPEQRKIAAILSSVDEAIEGTQAVIAQLQVVKKAMMADLLTRGIPGRHKSFKQTEIGEIPADWEVVRLRELLHSIDSGWSPQCESRPAGPEEWGVLKVSAVTSGVFLEREQKALPSKLEPRVTAEVRPGDVLLARANGVLELVGKTVLVWATRPRLMLSDKILRLRPDETRLRAPYLTMAMATAAVRSRLLSTTGGSHMRNVSQANLVQVLLPLPPVEEQAAIADALESVGIRATQEGENLSSLCTLKSALMSVLLTGEVRVKVDEEAAA